MTRCRLGLLVGGAGRSALNLHEAARQGAIPAEVALVIASRADIPAVARCREAGLPLEVLSPDAGPPDDQIDAALQRARVDLVCLCGWLRRFRVGNWRTRAINIHPALLPDFGGPGMYGDRVHAAALASGVPQSGCTVHLVDEQYDHGEIILQRRCAVMQDDTPATLAARVFAEEIIAYPEAIRRWCASRQC